MNQVSNPYIQNHKLLVASLVPVITTTLSPEIELTVFRIAQEVMSNIRRHSRATSLELTMDYSADALTLIIKDNGQGFHVPDRTSDLALSGKLGIIDMRERARLVSGTLIVQSEENAGTTVTLRVPY